MTGLFQQCLYGVTRFRRYPLFMVSLIVLCSLASHWVMAATIAPSNVPSLPVGGLPSNQVLATFPLLPARGPITSNYGWRSDPYTQKSKFHSGLDIGAARGSAVYGTQGGIVAYSGTRGGYGEVIVIQHHPHFHTLYAHLSKRLVQAGDRIYPGQTIGKVGSTGRATGPHLHFEVILDQQASDPVLYLTYLNQHPPLLIPPNKPVTSATPIASSAGSRQIFPVPSSPQQAVSQAQRAHQAVRNFNPRSAVQQVLQQMNQRVSQKVQQTLHKNLPENVSRVVSRQKFPLTVPLPLPSETTSSILQPLPPVPGLSAVMDWSDKVSGRSLG